MTPPSGAKPDIGNFTDDSSTIFNAGGNIFFTTPVSGAAFQWASNLGSFTLSAYLGPVLLDSFTVNVNTSDLNGSSGWGFYGFDGITLDRIGI